MPPVLKSVALGSLETWEWRVHARCREEDPALFFHPDGERGNDRVRRQRLARQICDNCPVIQHCHDHAIRFQEAFGTWGGLSEDERSEFVDIRKRRLRNRRSVDSIRTPDTPASAYR
ncbi:MULTISPECIES: WhiB family transcriptional regulator [Mycolicibacterium]|uniref:WhiB family transcriptional regulator n=1 Tax=Mycolicibacterium TaxID=1866885 RepID=UPI0009F245B0|nr:MULTISPECIES: WhiB family transcriptional regulator [Mycolicibacterium]